MNFTQLCEFLATKGGGYTLWVGAGASIALTGRTPSWKKLVHDLVMERTGKRRPRAWASLDYPDKLEWISGKIGHEEFRKELRQRLIEPIMSGPVNRDMLVYQALIGARASNVVSFNIEVATTACFGLGHGGSFAARTYFDGARRAPTWTTEPGTTSVPVYFPHGLLDTEGNCVMTRSEYTRHGMSLAVSTAVSLCLGGDLLILGMSMGDSYLRDAILRQREWIRNIYWVGKWFDYGEWAHVAGVKCVRAEYDEMWSGIADAHVRHSTELQRHRPFFESRLPTVYDGLVARVKARDDAAIAQAETCASNPNADPRELLHYERLLVDMGLAVPKSLRNHPAHGAGAH